MERGISMSDNFYLGAYEYIIVFRNGTHHIVDIWQSEVYDTDGVIFTGHYDKCLEERKRMEIAHAESLI